MVFPYKYDAIYRLLTKGNLLYDFSLIKLAIYVIFYTCLLN